MEEFITTKDIHLYYGKKEALKGINLSFPAKGINALIGPSGCGKSTYLRTLNRMNDLISSVTMTGSIMINGQDIYSPKMDTVDLRKGWAWFFSNLTPFLSRFMKMSPMDCELLVLKTNNYWMNVLNKV